MAKKRDIVQIEQIAKEFKMDSITRREFGDYVETCKRGGQRGTARGGDFTYPELRRLAEDFLAN